MKKGFSTIPQNIFISLQRSKPTNFPNFRQFGGLSSFGKVQSKNALFPKSLVLSGRKTSTSKSGSKDIYQTEIYHYSSIALAGLIPTALILSPSSIVFPIDLTLGILIPLHAHLGIRLVIADYLPRSAKLANIVLLVFTIVAGAGFLKLNLSGEGITESAKRLWRKPKSQE